jgi:hypothetical protein
LLKKIDANIVDMALNITIKTKASGHEDLSLIIFEAIRTQKTVKIDSIITTVFASLT